MDIALESVERFHREHYRGDDAHGIEHSRRVLRIANEIAEGFPISKDALKICAYFHDAVSFKKGSKSTSKRAKTETKTLLLDFFSKHTDLSQHMDVVFDCVDAHSFSDRKIPVYLEGRIIQDADKIDALGFTGIARVFMVAGKMGTRMVNSSDPFAERRELDDRTFAVDHFFTKLAKLPFEMNTEAGRRVALARWETMQEFVSGLQNEVSIPREHFD